MRILREGGKRLANKGFTSFVKLNNATVLSLTRDISHKRALFIYAYLSYSGGNNRAKPVNLNMFLDLLRVNSSTRSKESIKTALEKLIELNLITLYKDISLNELIELDEIVKKPKDTIWVDTHASDAEISYTLIPTSSIEEIVFSKSEEKTEDMFTVLAYICSKIERRDNISPVMWAGMNRIGKDIHITESKLSSILEELLRIKVIFYKKALMDGGKQNYVYGLYSDKESVENSVLIAESNNKVDKRLKSKALSDNVIDFVDDYYEIDLKLSNFFDRHSIVCNSGVANETNKYYQKHGQNKLLSILGEYNTEIINADNKIGAYRHLLKRNY